MTKSIEESERPAKVWQFKELSDKIDIVSSSQMELKRMILDQVAARPTGEELALELRERDHKIENLENKLASYSRFVWLIASGLVPTIVATIWQLIINK